MSYLEAIVMGIVQGATEFLPVSSSGHLAIFEKIFNMQEPGITFDILLHLGTLLAIFIVYFNDIKKLVVEGFKLLRDCLVNLGTAVGNLGKSEKKSYRRIISSSYRKFVMLVIVSTIPTGIMGVMMKDIVEVAKINMLIVGVCLLITACLLLISDRAKNCTKLPKNITYSNAFVVGICQGIATLPGISRSGTTITICLLSGFDRRFAVKYSFIMSIPAIMGAAVLELGDFASEIKNCDTIGQYVVGMLVAAVVGFICIKWVLSLIRSNKFKYFAYYCAVAGVAAIILNFVL